VVSALGGPVAAGLMPDVRPELGNTLQAIVGHPRAVAADLAAKPKVWAVLTEWAHAPSDTFVARQLNTDVANVSAALRRAAREMGFEGRSAMGQLRELLDGMLGGRRDMRPPPAGAGDDVLAVFRLLDQADVVNRSPRITGRDLGVLAHTISNGFVEHDVAQALGVNDARAVKAMLDQAARRLGYAGEGDAAFRRFADEIAARASHELGGGGSI
jgi:hypothetical protein